MLYKIFFVLFVLFSFSCSDIQKSDAEENDIETVIKISLDDLQKDKDYQSNISLIDTLLLQENENIVVGEINKIVLTDHNIFILDRKKARSVFMYQMDGTFIRTIGNVGPGVGEYVSPDGICVNSNNEEIIILDKNKQNFLFYNFEGVFVKSLKFDRFINDFCFYNENDLIIDSANMPDGATFSLTIIDKETGKIKHELFNKNLLVQNMPFMSSFPLLVSDNKILYQPSMSNSIYQIYNDSIKCKYKIDFGKYWPNEKNLEEIKDLHPKIIVDELKKNYILFPSLLETDRTIYVSFVYDDDIFVLFKDKTSEKQNLFIWDKNMDLSLPMGVVNNKFVSVKYHDDLPLMLLFYKIK